MLGLCACCALPLIYIFNIVRTTAGVFYLSFGESIRVVCCLTGHLASAGAARAASAMRRAGRRRVACGRRRGFATWLILPVVICLSQRLSHACVSMNNFRL